MLFVDGSENIKVKDCTFKNLHHGTSSTTGGYGVVFQGCQNTLINNCTFEKTINRRGIYLSTLPTPSKISKNHIVTDNVFLGRLGGSNDYPTGYEVHVKIRASSNVSVANNTFDGGLGGVFGEQTDDHTLGNFPVNVSVTGNTFKNLNSFNGDSSVIMCMNRDAKIENWSVTGNTVKNCACRFALLSDVENITISNNSVEIVSGENTTYNTIEVISGIRLKDVNITGNTLINNCPAANFIKFWMNSAVATAISNLIVSNNIITCDAYQASDIRGYSGSVDNISYTGNIISGYGGGSALQVSSDSTVNILFSDNICKSSSVNSRVLQVTSASGGDITCGNLGGTVSVPSSAVMVYSSSKANGARDFVSDSTPTVGEYVRGDILWVDSTSSGGRLGRICTTAGTAGAGAVFKFFGDID